MNLSLVDQIIKLLSFQIDPDDSEEIEQVNNIQLFWLSHNSI